MGFDTLEKRINSDPELAKGSLGHERLTNADLQARFKKKGVGREESPRSFHYFGLYLSLRGDWIVRGGGSQ